MERTVWVQDWQMQCCGEPFALGKRVSWPLSGEVDREYLGVVLGEQATAQSPTMRTTTTRATRLIEGAVRSIDAVWCRFARRGWADFFSFYLVPGTTLIESRTSATGGRSKAATSSSSATS